MAFDQKKIPQEQIWTYLPLEQKINQQINLAIGQQKSIAYLIVDSLFLQMPDSWTKYKLIITDNIPLNDIHGDLVPLYPEYWHVYHYSPVYQDRLPQYGYNCFMNRICEERGHVFQELKRRNILSKGLVSFNNLRPGNSVSTEQDVLEYGQPYNNIIDSLEQSIIDSNVSLVLETYTSDNHITFSEKIFRVLQLPRPWLLYCSPQFVGHLRSYGFDVLDDYVDHSYDLELVHSHRLSLILDRLEQSVDQQYNQHDYDRFKQASNHNKNLLLKLQQDWPAKFEQVLAKIKNYD
jgi:hypothetical protein